ncbi:MAG: EAL domain-containing protein [Spirochaetaceae bacterium]|nr:EAL domain-containing protein [Spirochaetaceae bacterium]
MDSYLKQLFPLSSLYVNEDWFQQIHDQKHSYQNKLLRSVLLLSIFFPPLLMTVSTLLGREPIILGSVLLTILFAGMWSFSHYFKGKGYKILVMLTALFIFLTGYYVNNYPYYLIVLMIVPILGIQLLGKRTGIIMSLIFPLSFLILNYLGQYDSFPQATYTIPILANLAVIAAFLFMLIISLLIWEFHNRNMLMLIRNILFDRVTSLPGQRVLKNHVNVEKTYFFGILKIENFTELGLIFGYELSDSLLVHVAGHLKQLGRTMDFQVYRLRGNEFGILKKLDPHYPLEQQGSQFLYSMHNRVENMMVKWMETHLTLNIIIGGTIVHRGNQEFLSQADLAVKEALEKHRPLCLFHEDSQVKELVLSNMNHYSILKDNLDEGSLETYFQPIVHSHTQEVIWYETLLRVREADGSMSSPVRYLPVAESTGLDMHLSSFVLRQALLAMEVLHTHVSVNLTFNDIRRPEFLESLRSHASLLKRCKGQLIIEILERQELLTLESCKNFLLEAKELGCLIAIDDFGSGYSNYCNILEIPVDIVKIDGALIQQLPKNVKARVLVNNIIQFSKKLNLKVVAEYVDSKEIEEILRQSGVDFLQGWLYGKAEPLAVFSA